MINVVLIPIFIWINYWIHFWDLLHLTIGQFSLTKFSEYYQLLVMQEVSTIFAVFVLWVIFEFLLLELILLVVGVVLLVELLQNLASMFFQNPTHHHKHNNNKHHNVKHLHFQWKYFDFKSIDNALFSFKELSTPASVSFFHLFCLNCWLCRSFKIISCSLSSAVHHAFVKLAVPKTRILAVSLKNCIKQ